jgi:hypothetical protein
MTTESEQPRKLKCTVRENRIVEPCAGLSDASEAGNPSGIKRGIFAWVYFNTQSEESGPSRIFFGAKSGNATKNGVAFNYCPFCGEQIDAPFTKN